MYNVKIAIANCWPLF